MQLTEQKIESYLDSLSSDAPAPGGGAAAALSGAQGIALSLMVIHLTRGKKKYAEWFSLCEEVENEAAPLLRELTAGMDEDKDAFSTLSAAYKMPKETEEEQAERRRTIAKATLRATEVPMKAMKQGLQGLRLTERLVGKSNPGAVSDLGVAALNLLSCVKSAWLNVLINLPGIKDAPVAEDFRRAGTIIYEEAQRLAERIYEQVADQLR